VFTRAASKRGLPWFAGSLHIWWGIHRGVSKGLRKDFGQSRERSHSTHVRCISFCLSVVCVCVHGICIVCMRSTCKTTTTILEAFDLQIVKARAKSRPLADFLFGLGAPGLPGSRRETEDALAVCAFLNHMCSTCDLQWHRLVAVTHEVSVSHLRDFRVVGPG
jgi:hypothetical protein